MGKIVVKADQEHDLYSIWSSVVDAPIVIGTRDQVLEWMDEYWGTSSLDKNREDMTRADETGSSSRYGYGKWGPKGYMVFEQKGICPRDKIYEFLNGDESVLKPFDDDKETESSTS